MVARVANLLSFHAACIVARARRAPRAIPARVRNQSYYRRVCWLHSEEASMDEPRDTRAQQASNILNSAAEMASNSAAKMSDAAQAAGQKAKDTASALAGQAGEHVKGVLNDQVNVGADLVGHVADSVRAAADTLEPNSPQLASMARLAASGIDGFSDRLRDRTVE